MTTPPCLLSSWHQYESELYYWLLSRTADGVMSFDLLQETFLRALQLQTDFCNVRNQRAWLYSVAHHLLVDEQRRSAKLSELCEEDFLNTEMSAEVVEPIDSLAQCLPNVLLHLNANAQDILKRCDIEGMPQKAYAKLHSLSLSATKSRLLRARKQLKLILKSQCHIKFDENNHVCCFYSDTK
ncbi:sigma-70 family RNA polymerase sigma factor [Vibrio viridaestus]|uniref:Sigma-70 family RNA polymerase sigma factor n=1 Tax=Vibrio viridaestus TaxID=2487322 RepID=A0A3N9TKI1_9VIBR|nr:sigma-70 family RNA polymerase sigma factor [Vibrio viridaestus]RQW64494.1 sigma-70 family RNA polymerase sigma factor [Vibrio viridaestus]